MLTFDGKPISWMPGKESANKEPPTNKFVVEKLYKVHRKRINKMEPVVDCHFFVPDFLTNTSWKQITEQHRREVITKQNEVIYKRIAKAENTESLITSENREHIKRVEHELKLMKRLKQMGRIRDILKVQRENEDLLVRIDRARPEYGRKNIQEWYRHHELFKQGRRSDPTAGHLGFRGMKGLFPKALPPVESPNARAIKAERAKNVSSPISRGNVSDLGGAHSPSVFSLESNDPMSVTMDGSDDMLQSSIDAFDSLIEPSLQSKHSKKSNSTAKKSETKKKKDVSYAKEVATASDPSQNASRSATHSREKAVTRLLASKGSNSPSRVGTPSNSSMTIAEPINLQAIHVHGYITLLAKFVPIPFTNRNVILQMLIQKQKSNASSDNMMTVNIRDTTAPYEILNTRQAPLDRVYEVVSTQGTSSLFTDSAIISDIAQMRDSFNTMFREIDSDGNGYLTFDEFAKLIKDSRLGIEQADLRTILSQADENGNGVVEFEEFYPLILDLTLSFRTMNAARKIVSKRQAVIDEEATRRMVTMRSTDASDAILLKLSSCDPKKTGVVRATDLKRCLIAMAGPLNVTEDEIAMIQRLLPMEGYARVQYSTLPEVYKVVKWTSCRNRMQEDIGSSIYKYLLRQCQALDTNKTENLQKGTISIADLSKILESSSEEFELNTVQRITLMVEARKIAAAEEFSLEDRVSYHKILGVISKGIELMTDPSMLRQRAELLNPETDHLSVTKMVDELTQSKQHGSGGGQTPAFLRSLFNLSDVNKSETISLKEFTMCLKAVKLDLNDDEIKTLFTQADTGNTGALTFPQFAFFFEKNLAAIHRSNHMKAVYVGLHDNSSTMRALGGEAAQLQQLKDLEEHLEYVFKTADTANSGKLEKNEIQLVLQQIDVTLSPFQISTILDEMFADEDGFVQIKDATTVSAHLLQVFLAEENLSASEEHAEQAAKRIVKLMARDIHRIVHFFVSGIHEIDNISDARLLKEETRNHRIELLVHSPHSGLCPTEANHVMHTLFNQAYREGKICGTQPADKERLIEAQVAKSNELQENVKNAKFRRESVRKSVTYKDNTQETVDKKSDVTATGQSGGTSNEDDHHEQTTIKGRSARSSILDKSKTALGNRTSSNSSGLPNQRANRKTLITSHRHWVPSEQELADAIARAKKETIMRCSLHKLNVDAAAKALLLSFEHAKELLSLQNHVEWFDNYLPVRVAFDVLEDCLHFRINRSQIIALIVFSNCFDRTETMIEYKRFAQYAAIAVSNLHLTSEIEKRARAVDLIAHEIAASNAAVASSQVQVNHKYDALGISESRFDRHILEEFLKVEDSVGEVSQEEFIRIITSIPGIVMTTKDAITVSAGFPHTPKGAVHWQKFVPWAYKTISSLMLEHMIKRRLTIFELDATSDTSTNTSGMSEIVLGKEVSGNSAMSELVKLAENVSELLKIRQVTQPAQPGAIAVDSVLVLFPFDADEMVQENGEYNDEEEVLASLDTLSVDQGADGLTTVLYSSEQVLLQAQMVEPPKMKPQVPKGRMSEIIPAAPGSPIAVSSPTSPITRKASVVRSAPAMDAVHIPHVEVAVTVTAAELADFSIDRELIVQVKGIYDYTANKRGPPVPFDVALDCTLPMPSLCLIDIEAAKEFASTIPNLLILELTKGGVKEPKLMLKRA